MPGGFTLIEVIGAVLAFLAVWMATGFAGAHPRQVERSALRARAVTAAGMRMAELERLPYDSLTLCSMSESLTIRGTDSTCTSVVAQFDTRVRSLTVTVERDGSQGPSRELDSHVFGPW